MLEFAIRLAVSHCRGLKHPSREEICALLRGVGEFYKRCVPNVTTPVESVFVGRALFFNRVEGNIDQTLESVWRRFQKHDRFLEDTLGFNVANAVFFARSLMRAVIVRMEGEKPPKTKKLTKSERYDFSFFVQPEERIVRKWTEAISFTQHEIALLFPEHLRTKLERYLDFASIDVESFPEINNPLETNPLFAFPFVKLQNRYLIPTPYYLLHGLTDRLQQEILKDPKYKGKYGKEKGKFLEEWTHEELRLLFRSGKIFRGVKYKFQGSEPDADLIISCGEYLIFVECTTKGISQSPKQGKLESIEDTLAKSIRKCYHQALRAKHAYLDGRLKLPIATKASKLLLMIVTDTQYPNLLSEFALAKRFGVESYLSQLVQDNEYPYIISIYDLETMRFAADEQTFIEFIDERLAMYENPVLLAYDEMDYFILFSKPEYKVIKNQMVQHQTTLSYIAHLPSPAFKSHTFHYLLDIIGSDSFAVVKIGEKYDTAIATIAFSLLYDIYCDWHVVLDHFVFDSRAFKLLLRKYAEKGEKCRVVAWEGFYEYLDFCKKTGRTEEANELAKSVKDGSMGQNLNVLITFPTDIYEEMQRKAIEEYQERHSK